MSMITLLDGSIGQELVKRGGDKASPLWSTRAMIDHPEMLRRIHDEYFAAGAGVATTNTYSVLSDRLEQAGLAGQIPALLDAALGAARAARDAHGSGRIAGSIGPLGASYRPDLTASRDEARKIYAGNVKRMDPAVDFFLIETMSSLHQAKTALEAVGFYATRPLWLAVTVDDEDGSRLRSGEPLGDISTLIGGMEGHSRPAAVLINCSRPEAVDAGLDALRATGLPFGAYANGFTEISGDFLKARPTVDALQQRRDLGPGAYADLAMGWVDRGAVIIGGCCEVGVGHIAELARRLRAAGHETT